MEKSKETNKNMNNKMLLNNKNIFLINRNEEIKTTFFINYFQISFCFHIIIVLKMLSDKKNRHVFPLFVK